MSGKRIIWFVLFALLLIGWMGCGKKAPPRLPEKSSSLILATKAPRHERANDYQQRRLSYDHWIRVD